MVHWILRTFTIVMFCTIGACDGYTVHDIGDETELLSANGKFGVKPDVVFYEKFDGEVFGVRRLSDPASTVQGYWSNCELFRLSNSGVEYWNLKQAYDRDADKKLAGSISFAKQTCLNFQ